jgi:hypothetical protein
MRVLEYLPSVALIATAAIFTAARPASAALYGNFVGPTITYQNVSEFDTQITSPPPVISTPASLFGAPQLIPAGSDSLTFPNITFSALAADGSLQQTDGQLTFNFVPTDGALIHSLSFDEGGSYHLIGDTGNASDQALLAVNDVRITSVDGKALASPIIVPAVATPTVTPLSGAPTVTDSSNVNGATTLLVTATLGSNDTGTWDITALFNFDAALAGAGLAGQQITGVSVALDDQLTASTDAQTLGHTLASIDKKRFIIMPGTPVGTTFPEPASLSLLIGGGLLLARRPRREGSK